MRLFRYRCGPMAVLVAAAIGVLMTEDSSGAASGLLGLAVQQSGPSPTASDVLRLDPALDTLIPPGAAIEKVSGGLQRAEGPLWQRSGGYLLLSDLNEIMKWEPGRPLSIFRNKTYSGATPPGVRVGTNGLALDRDGRLVAVEHGNRRLSRFASDGTVTTLADRYMSRRFNSPNDLAIRKNGDIYFTDLAFFATQTPPLTGPEFGQELEFSGVFRWREHGDVDLLIRDLGGPNGIAFSPDETQLYVSNGGAVRQWLAYRVNPDGTLGAKRVLFEMPSDAGPGGPDGMKVDVRGNLWATGPGGVIVLSPQGKHLGTIQTAEIASNCAFGDSDGKTLYITARTGLYRIRLSVAGW